MVTRSTASKRRSRRRSRREREAEKAFKTLFESKYGKLSYDRIREKIKAFQPFFLDQRYGKYNDDDCVKLVVYSQPQELSCFVEGHIDKLKWAAGEAERKYPAVANYFRDNVLGLQLQICLDLAKKKVIEFQNNSLQRWQLIVDLSQQVEQTKVGDNESRVESAIKSLVQRQAMGSDEAQEGEKLEKEVERACRLYSNRVGQVLKSAAPHPESNASADMATWMRYLGVCKELVDFQEKSA